MAAGNDIVRQVGRHTAIGALQWLPLASIDDSDPRSEIKIQAKLQGTRFGVTQERTGGRWQVGFLTPSAPAAHRRAYSIAYWLSSTVTQPTIYVEHLGKDLWWVLAATPASVDARTDVILNEDEAIERVDGVIQEFQQLDAEFAIFVWGDRELPSNMLPRFTRTRRPITEVLGTEPPPREARLDQLVGVRPMTWLALFGLLIVGALSYVAYVAYQAGEERKRLALEQQRLIEARIAEERLKSLTEIRIAEAVHRAVAEDTSKPTPSHIVRACLAGAGRIGAVYGGWQVTRMECDAGATALTVSLSQIVGPASIKPTNADLVRKARADGLQPALTIGATSASLSVPLTGAANRAPIRLSDLPKQRQVLEHLASRIQLVQAYGATGTAADISPPAPRQVTYINPALDDAIGDPARIVPVPDERGFRVGAINIRGSASWMLTQINLDDPFVYINAVQFTPTIAGFDFQLEAAYVLAAD